MPGMNSGPGPGSPILVSAFRSALLQQWLIVALIFILLLIAWGATRTAIYGSVAGAPPAGRWREPRARLLLRVGFGSIWLFDGILQAQPQMAGGLADQVIQPSASSSPAWVQHLVNFGVTAWDYHPVQAASASVWIQVGIGLWMLIAVRGWSARLAGVAGVAWGLVVWAFGEAFGGIFAPGLTFLFGAPGAVLIYVVAGVLLALPERAWDDPRRLGRLLLGGAGAFLLGMALLQAWPGRGFWQGTLDGQPGSLAAMIKSMAGTSQPHAPEAIVSGFGNFTAAHGFAVNLVAVLALAVVGAGLFIAAVRGDLRLARIAVIAGAVFCLADWVLVEDLGFFGGLGTDPNSMIPFILLFTAGYLGLAPAPARAAATASGVPEVGSAGLSAGIQGAGPITETASASGIPGTEDTGPITEISGISGAPAPDIPDAAVDTGETTVAGETGTGKEIQVVEVAATAEETEGARVTRVTEDTEVTAGDAQGPPEDISGPSGAHPRAGRVPVLLRAFAGAPVRVVAGVGALGVILVGAAPMAVASVNRTADPIVAEALAGTSGQVDTPAPGFTLTSQDGRQVSLASLRGKVVLLTFLDPVCTTDCPLIAKEMLLADTLLGGKAGNTELVAVVANPTYTSTAYTRTFTSQEGLGQTPNWLFLTGSLSQLTDVWHHYGIEVEDLPAGAMTAHNDLAFVISANGTVQQEISDDPGPGTPATTSSFAGLMANSVLQSMGQS
jgi:cytochrome oxidase Cu insertion factor (SCO1/SenC/PrrC family)